MKRKAKTGGLRQAFGPSGSTELAEVSGRGAQTKETALGALFVGLAGWLAGRETGLEPAGPTQYTERVGGAVRGSAAQRSGWGEGELREEARSQT